MNYRAVIFDLGGVVLGSPLQAISDYERSAGLEPGVVGRVIVAGGAQGAWSRLERGEIDRTAFHAVFAAECRTAGAEVDTRRLFEFIAQASEPRPEMLAAIARIRARGLKAAALTNNWAPEEGEEGRLGGEIGPCFDAVFESAVLGLRKPDPRVYRYVCAELGIGPEQAVFLDDIGANLKSARALGMRTIRVVEPREALAELERALGFGLLQDAGAGSGSG
ncbi:MAG: HAD family phosphatase [Proteobacteria bacterium]|nr:HAD family phosphatase [Pseudomonadota bacterium]